MATYKPLQSAVLTSSSSEVVFSGIDQNYTDLILSFNGTGSTSANLNVQLNGDTGSNYSFTALYGTGSTAASNRGTGTTYIRAGYITTAQTGTILQFQNYINTTTYKTVLMRDFPSGGDVEIAASLWRNTAAVTSIRFYPSSGTFAAGTTIDLYGIKSGAPQALGGDTVTTDGNYWYHTFRSTGTFTPLKTLSVDYLVVAGGGGGGSSDGPGNGGAAGGGAGGLRSTVTATGGNGSVESALSVASQLYTVTVGAGGAGATAGIQGTSGSSSIFSSITSIGGGGGGSTYSPNNYVVGLNGGSGGGSYSNTVGQGTSNQGFNGGPSNGNDQGGGGGGASAAGNGATSNTGGAGGAGRAVAISGTSVTYAGGGGGGAYSTNTAGTGGAGGGGNGAAGRANGSAATTNTGSGGGAGGGSPSVTGVSLGGNGGSGIVIVRYPV